jgi:hypothetical protein
MAKKPEPPPKPIRWGIYKLASKAVWLGNVEAPDEAPLDIFRVPKFDLLGTSVRSVVTRTKTVPVHVSATPSLHNTIGEPHSNTKTDRKSLSQRRFPWNKSET